jgi:hypothetical protein
MEVEVLGLRELREQAGVSRAHAAARAGVTEHLARIYELGGAEAIKNPRKCAALVRVYEGFRESPNGAGEGTAA